MRSGRSRSLASDIQPWISIAPNCAAVCQAERAVERDIGFVALVLHLQYSPAHALERAPLEKEVVNIFGRPQQADRTVREMRRHARRDGVVIGGDVALGDVVRRIGPRGSHE